jgi:hypothetical protein
MGFGRPKEGGGLSLLGVHIAWWCIVIFYIPLQNGMEIIRRRIQKKLGCGICKNIE